MVLGLACPQLSAQLPLEIVSPRDGTLFRPGQTVTITVRTNRKYKYVGIIPGTPLTGEQMLDAEPYIFSLPLPPDLDAGLYHVTAVGAPGSPGSVGFDSSDLLEIDVEPIWPSSADGSRLVRDAPGIMVDTGGIPLRHRSAISYPHDALAHGIEGTVVIEITPTWDGHVEGVHVLSGPVELARHVILSVSAWHYAERVGSTKPRRVSITFSLADAKRPVSPGRAGDGPPTEKRLVDNTNNEFWASFDRSKRYTLNKVAILGVSEDDTDQLMALYRRSQLRQGEEVSQNTLATLIGPALGFDRDLRIRLQREGSEVSITIAPIGFLPGDSAGSPAIQTQRVPPGVDPERILVSAAEQAGKLISKVAPEYPLDAQMRYVQGIVRVAVVIGRDGRVLSTDASGPLPLWQAAEDAVKQWVYSPTVVNGYRVEVCTVVELEFFLPY